MRLMEEALTSKEPEANPDWYAIYMRHQHEKFTCMKKLLPDSFRKRDLKFFCPSKPSPAVGKIVPSSFHFRFFPAMFSLEAVFSDGSTF
jgi:hypothetical protein